MLLILCTGAGWWQWGRQSVPKVEASAGFTGLEEAKQKEIWDAEHVTFEIETYVGRKLVAELQKRSTGQLAGFFHEDFSGVVPQRTSADIVEKSSITETTYAVDMTGSTNVDADGFSRFLVEGIHAVPQDGKGRFRVLKIAHVVNEGSVDTWQLDVLLTLGGTNSAGAPISYVSNGRMSCRFSNDDDIVAGRIIQSWHVDSETVRSGPHVLLHEATSSVGLDRL
ncbi:MAG: hypothetical protein P8J37_09800, partial [Fuerstiella sp.]|nr:hypothetical protein [Fuerstiella sp.]